MDEKIPSKKESFLIYVLVGAVMGIGGILPGVSGGVLAVSLGLYEPIIDAIAGFFKTPKRSFLFLLPIGIGSAAGFLLGAFAISGILQRYNTLVTFLFLGLVAGGIPSYIKEANERGFKKRYLLATLAGALLAGTLLLMKNDASATELESLTPIKALISGAIVGAGAVLPGVSTAFILIYLGWYKAMMAAFSTLDVTTLIFLGAGALACFISIVKLARWLFDRFHGWAYYCVLGFVIVSAALIFPGFGLTAEHLLGAAAAVVGFLGAYFLGKINL